MKKLIQILLTISSVLFFWELITFLMQTPEYFFPRPSVILHSLFTNLTLLLTHLTFTLTAVSAGFIVAIIFALLFSTLSLYSSYVKDVLYPLLITIQITPKIALAPLFLIWVGQGILPKIIISSMICFFPMAIEFKKGLESIDQNMIDILRSVGATKKQILLKLQFPFALQHIFSGLKIGISLAFIGTIVGEFISGSKGLGYQIMYSSTLLDTSLVFASILMIITTGFLLYVLILYLEKKIIFWEEKKKLD